LQKLIDDAITKINKGMLNRAESDVEISEEEEESDGVFCEIKHFLIDYLFRMK
jgi:hypothetical protein